MAFDRSHVQPMDGRTGRALETRGGPGRGCGGPRARQVAACLWLTACGLLVAGCGGGADIPESRIYRIGYVPPAAASGGNPLPVTLGVAGLGGAETYQQERLVYRTLPHKVAYYPYDRWEVPPVEMVTDALIRQLRAGGLYRRVVPYTRDGQVDYMLRGRLLRFDEEDGGPGTPWTAVVEIDYQLVDPQKGQVVSTGLARATQPVQGRQVEAIVESLTVATREAVGSLAAQVARSIPSPAR